MKAEIPAGCEIPPTGFKSWHNGKVTTLHPAIVANCSEIFLGNKSEINETLAKNKAWKNSLTDTKLFHMSGNCTWVTQYFKEDEDNFSLIEKYSYRI